VNFRMDSHLNSRKVQNLRQGAGLMQVA